MQEERENYLSIGRIKKTYGNDGQLRFTIFDGYEKDLSSSDHFFVDLEGIFVPFFYDKTSYSNGLFKLDQINSLKKAAELVSRPIFLEKSKLSHKPKKENTLYYAGLKGFTLIDQDDKTIGVFNSIEAYPMQEMGILEDGNAIPLSDQLILEINESSRLVKMELPEGLLLL
jgi:ribosomal 30S subunit maturation factor RimM